VATWEVFSGACLEGLVSDINATRTSFETSTQLVSITDSVQVQARDGDSDLAHMRCMAEG
jgi:hypothetical protein